MVMCNLGQADKNAQGQLQIAFQCCSHIFTSQLRASEATRGSSLRQAVFDRSDGRWKETSCFQRTCHPCHRQHIIMHATLPQFRTANTSLASC